MKRIHTLSGVLVLLVLTACQYKVNSNNDCEIVNASTEDFLQSRLNDYSVSKNSICKYNSDNLYISEDRTVEINLSARDRLEGYTFSLSSSDISEPRTLNELFISVKDFLNSFSPSSPIFKPIVSDILRHLLGKGHKNRALRLCWNMKNEQP